MMEAILAVPAPGRHYAAAVPGPVVSFLSDYGLQDELRIRPA